MKYEKPNVDIIKFETDDVIVTSGTDSGSIKLRPDETDIVTF